VFPILSSFDLRSIRAGSVATPFSDADEWNSTISPIDENVCKVVVGWCGWVVVALLLFSLLANEINRAVLRLCGLEVGEDDSTVAVGPRLTVPSQARWELIFSCIS
jgi:hypothetical protein